MRLVGGWVRLVARVGSVECLGALHLARRGWRGGRAGHDWRCLPVRLHGVGSFRGWWVRSVGGFGWSRVLLRLNVWARVGNFAALARVSPGVTGRRCDPRSEGRVFNSSKKKFSRGVVKGRTIANLLALCGKGLKRSVAGRSDAGS